MGKAAKKSPPKDPGGHKWKGPLPKGWTDASRKKFWDSLTSAAPKHKVTECIKRMDGKVSDPGAFCAALADRSIPGWRQEAAKERRKKKKARVPVPFTREELNEYGRIAGEWADATGETDPLSKVAHAVELAAFAVALNFDEEGKLITSSVTAPGLTLTQPLRTRRDYGEGDDEEDEDEPQHSKLPGSDNLTMEEDHRVASRIASRWLQQSLRTAKYDPRFMQQMGGRMFRHPDTGNQVRFISLPSTEQSKVYRQWAARAQQQQRMRPEDVPAPPVPPKRQRTPEQEAKQKKVRERIEALKERQKEEKRKKPEPPKSEGKKKRPSAWERGGGGREQREWAPEHWFSSLKDDEKDAVSSWVGVDSSSVSEATGISTEELERYAPGGTLEDKLDIEDLTWISGMLHSTGRKDEVEKLKKHIRQQVQPVIDEIQEGRLEQGRETQRKRREERERGKRRKASFLSVPQVEMLWPAFADRMRVAGSTRMPTKVMRRHLGLRGLSVR